MNKNNKLKRHVFQAGAPIFKEGEVGDTAYIIDKGAVEISTIHEGDKIVLAHLEENDLFGEMALIDNDLRTASATALKKSKVFILERERLQEDLENAPKAIKLMMKVVLKRFRDTRNHWLHSENQCSDNPQISAQQLHQEKSIAEDKHLLASDLRFESEIDTGMDKREFILYYQPIYNIQTKQISGFEALVRWRHPHKGILSPNDFIGMVEQTGQIIPMGSLILEEACQGLKRIQSFSDDPLTINVNLSVRQLEDFNSVDKIIDTVVKNHLSPAQVKLEITESLLMNDPEQSQVQLTRLHEAGFKLIVDDFGTGYSSLSYLSRFPIDSIKIDRSFITKMKDDHRSMTIVHATNSLGHNLDMEVVAEGVEDEEELQILESLNCDYIQGFFISKPLPEHEIIRFLVTQQ